jgi:hypothetical protein
MYKLKFYPLPHTVEYGRPAGGGPDKPFSRVFSGICGNGLAGIKVINRGKKYNPALIRTSQFIHTR